MISGDFIQGIVWLSSGLLVTLFSTQYSMGSLSEPGPGALPFGLGLVFILLSAILLIRSWPPRKIGSERGLPFGRKWHKVLIINLLLVVDTFLLESLGYLLSIFIMITLSMLIMEPKRWVSALLLGIISSFSSYVLFDVWLKVQLPKGLFYFWG